MLADDAFAEKDIPADVEEDIEVFCDCAGTAAGQTFFEAADWFDMFLSWLILSVL